MLKKKEAQGRKLNVAG